MKKIFTVYDQKSEAYLQPFFFDTEGQAVRALTDCVNDPKHQFGVHPEDYTLFSLGEYDESTAKISTHKTPVALAKCIELISGNPPYADLSDPVAPPKMKVDKRQFSLLNNTK